MSDSSLKKKFDFILVEPSHPGNIGATARAIKNMGFSNLSLINPKGFPNDDAFYRAKGAKDILENAKIYEDLSNALKEIKQLQEEIKKQNQIIQDLKNN